MWWFVILFFFISVRTFFFLKNSCLITAEILLLSFTEDRVWANDDKNRNTKTAVFYIKPISGLLLIWKSNSNGFVARISFLERSVTVFAYCLHTFCRIRLIMSKLYTQANQTKQLGINNSHICQNQNLTKWNSCNKIIHTSTIWITLSYHQQHTDGLYIKHCSLYVSVFFIVIFSDSVFCKTQR